jgi:ribosomal protein S27AE
MRRWRKSNTGAFKAHMRVQSAIVSGDLVKPKRCEVCGRKSTLDAHHEDYNKPLNVQWLCRQCHSIRHSVGAI